MTFCKEYIPVPGTKPYSIVSSWAILASQISSFADSGMLSSLPRNQHINLYLVKKTTFSDVFLNFSKDEVSILNYNKKNELFGKTNKLTWETVLC